MSTLRPLGGFLLGWFVMMALLALADPAWPQPPKCNPAAYAHVTSEDDVARMVEALEAAIVTATPEERERVRGKAGLTPGMMRACRERAKKGRPEHAGGGR